VGCGIVNSWNSVSDEEGSAEARAGNGDWVDIDMQDRLT